MEKRYLIVSIEARAMESFRLDGKIAVVTGGASGIGCAIVRRFARSGACIRILDIDQKQAEAVARDVVSAGGNASAFPCDVANAQDVKTVFEQLCRKEHVQILVNNAGISHVGRLETTTEADFDRIFQVNVKGFYNCMQASIGQMKANGGGVILNMASIAGSSGLADRFAYSMSKGAVIAMTYSVAKDYLESKICVICVS